MVRHTAVLLGGCLLPTLVMSAPQDILLEAELEPARVFVQTQAVYRLRFHQAVDVREIKIAGPSARLAEFRQIGEERVYETVREGRRYRVRERAYAVFPFASGALEIVGGHAEGLIADPESRAKDGRRVVRVEAASQVLDVLPLPLGAGVPASSLRVSETWSPAADGLRAGDILRRGLRIDAVGIDAGQLPETHFAPPGIAVHAEPARLENRFEGERNHATREQSFSMVVPSSGEIRVPELRLNWWNAESATAAVAILPARVLSVSGGGDVDATAPAAGPWLALGLAAFGIVCAALGLSRRRCAELRAYVDLRRSCRAGDAAAVRDGLLARAAMVWPLDPPRTLGSLAARLEDRVARAAIERLDRSLYGRPTDLPAGNPLSAIADLVLRGLRRART